MCLCVCVRVFGNSISAMTHFDMGHVMVSAASHNADPKETIRIEAKPSGSVLMAIETGFSTCLKCLAGIYRMKSHIGEKEKKHAPCIVSAFFFAAPVRPAPTPHEKFSTPRLAAARVPRPRASYEELTGATLHFASQAQIEP